MPKKSVVTPFEKSKENRSYEFKRAISHYYISANEVRGELKTIGTADVKHICYATETMTLEWQTQGFFKVFYGPYSGP